MSIAQNLAEQERKAAGGQGSGPKQKREKKPAKKAKLAESPPQAEPPPKAGAAIARAKQCYRGSIVQDIFSQEKHCRELLS